MADNKTTVNLFTELKKESEKLEKDLKGFAKTSVEESKREMRKMLHEYNEVKDATQIIIGVLANMENITIKQVHQMFNLPTE